MDQFTPHISAYLDDVSLSLRWLLPEYLLAMAFILLIFHSVFTAKRSKELGWWLTLVLVLASCLALCVQLDVSGSHALFLDLLMLDRESVLARLLIGFCTICFLLILRGSNYWRERGPNADLLMITVGMVLGLYLLVLSASWMMVFISIEMVSLASYILVNYHNGQARQSEAGLKYLLVGTACSAIMLYGISFLYGYSGGLNFLDAGQLNALSGMPVPLFILAMTFALVGIGFKLSMVPFHIWSPDVYQGTPAFILSFLTTAPKIAAAFILLRMLVAWEAEQWTLWPLLSNGLVVASIASMLVGNLAALRQRNLKRMMAYSSIGHTGFLLMILAVNPAQAFQSLLFYSIAYSIASFGLFSILSYFEEEYNLEAFQDYSGLGRTFPIWMSAAVVCLISLIGLPPLAGFLAKVLLFSGVWQKIGGQDVFQASSLLITGAIATVVSLFYYFRWALYAFLKTSTQEIEVKNRNFSLVLVVLFTILVVLIGLMPENILNVLM